MGIISTNDGTGDKINNISTELDIIKNDITTLKELSTKVEEHDTSINNVSKIIDAVKLKGLYSLYDWNKGLTVGSNNYVSTSTRTLNIVNRWSGSINYDYCMTMALKGEVPDVCK